MIISIEDKKESVADLSFSLEDSRSAVVSILSALANHGDEKAMSVLSDHFVDEEEGGKDVCDDEDEDDWIEDEFMPI